MPRDSVPFRHLKCPTCPLQLYGNNRECPNCHVFMRYDCPDCTKSVSMKKWRDHEGGTYCRIMRKIRITHEQQLHDIAEERDDLALQLDASRKLAAAIQREKDEQMRKVTSVRNDDIRRIVTFKKRLEKNDARILELEEQLCGAEHNLDDALNSVSRLEADLADSEKRLVTVNCELDTYKEFGTPSEIQHDFDQLSDQYDEAVNECTRMRAKLDNIVQFIQK